VPALQKIFVFICVYLRSSVDNISFAIFAAFALFAAKSIFFNASAMNYHRFIQKQASI